MFGKSGWWAGFAIAIASITGAASAAPFQNGSFESASVNPGGGFLTLGNGNTSITGWTVGGGGIDYIGGYWQPAEGSRSIDLSATSPGSIQQIFDTILGTTYQVTFALAGNPAAGPAVKTGTVQAGAFSQPFSFDVTGHSLADMGWTDNVFLFTAAGASTTLSFISTTAGVAGPALDDVRVVALTPVPVPAALPLMGSALGALVLMARRRKAKA